MVRIASLADEVVVNLGQGSGDVEAVSGGDRGRQLSRVILPEGIVDLVGVRVACVDNQDDRFERVDKLSADAIHAEEYGNKIEQFELETDAFRLFVTTSELYINAESTLNEGHSEYDRTNYSIASSLAFDAVGEFEDAKAALEDRDIAALDATRDRFLSLIKEKIAEAEELDADARQAEQETN